MDSDDDLEQDFQQGFLCVSVDPRRVGGPGGEPTIINLKELRTLLCTQQTREDGMADHNPSWFPGSGRRTGNSDR